MTVLRAFVMAFSTYSRIPMPKVRWEEKSEGYQMCFFPAVGLFIGAAMAGMECLCQWLLFGDLFRALLLAAIPILLTGGIHLDGFLDTVDALSSCGTREKKLMILKDPNAGAFAVVHGGMWLLAYTASLTEIHRLFLLLLPGYVLSRALSALAVLTFSPARSEGMGAALHRQAVSKIPIVSSVGWSLAAVLVMVYLSWVAAVLVSTVCLGEFFYYHRKCQREFGGFTGDLAGWFLCRCELAICLVLAVLERVMALWC